MFTLNNKECPDEKCPAGAPKCYFNDIFVNQKTKSAECSDTLQHIDLKYNPKSPSSLIIAIQGGSGRTLDPLQNDRKTPAALLWGRATAHGGCSISFNTDTLTSTWFEGDKSVFKFNTINSTSDKYPVIENYVNAKLDGSLIAKDGKSYLEFDYTKHVDSNSSSFLKLGFLLLAAIFVIFN